jgi:YebC/PmpR family DNA-binding regulatory protein
MIRFESRNYLQSWKQSRSYAGHSHWANIKHKKERSDLIKMATFGKLSGSIKNAVRLGGANPIENPLLASYLDTARKIGYPKEKVNAAIRSGLGEGPDGGGESVMYECRGSDTTMMVFAHTDNKHRTTANVKTILNKYSDGIYGVGGGGSASFMFIKEGILQVKNEGKTSDEIMDIMLMSNVSDFVIENSDVNVTVDPNELKAVKDALAEQGLTKITKAEIRYRPRSYVIESDPPLLEKLIGLLMDDGDVTEVVHNVDLEASWEKYEKLNE